MNLLNTTVLQAISFALFIVALPLLSFGTMEDQQVLWWLGVAMVIVAGIIPPLARFVGQEDDEDEADEESGERAAEEGADEGEATDGDGDAGDQRDDDDETRPPPEGPVGERPAPPGREPQRARVKEQEEHQP